MLISALALLLPAPVLSVSPVLQTEVAHQAASPEAARAAGLSVQQVCRTGAPSMFSGRVRKESCALKVVKPTCRSTAPTMFSGRARTTECDVVMKEPEVPTHAPSIFSGRRARPSTGYAAPRYSYVVAPDGTATPQVTVQTVEEAKAITPRRRLPSMFTGRRPKPAAQPAQ